MTRQRRLPDATYKLNKTKKLAHGLGDPSDGLHDPPLERTDLNATICVQGFEYAQ